MLGKLAGAFVGSKIAGKDRGPRGALLGFGVAALGRRGLGPLIAALAVGWGARKLYRQRSQLDPRKGR